MSQFFLMFLSLVRVFSQDDLTIAHRADQFLTNDLIFQFPKTRVTPENQKYVSEFGTLDRLIETEADLCPTLSNSVSDQWPISACYKAEMGHHYF